MAEEVKTAEKAATADPKKKRLRTQILIIVIIAVLVIIAHFVSGGRVLTANNIKNILVQMSYPMMLGLGMMFIFSSGNIDLSIGAQIILAANVGAVSVMIYNLGYPGLIIGTIVVMIVCQLIVNFFSQYLNVPSWVAGLGCALVFEALGTIFVGAYSESLGSSVVYLKKCTVFGTFPLMFIIAVIVFIVAYFIFNHTQLGFNLRAIGGGGEVAQAMGINKRKTIFEAATVGAILIGVGAICQLSYTGRFTVTSGMGSLSGIFKPLAVVLISGSFSRIYNDAVGCVIGAFIIAALFNILTLMGVPSGSLQDICLGVVVIICGVFAARGFKGVQK